MLIYTKDRIIFLSNVYTSESFRGNPPVPFLPLVSFGSLGQLLRVCIERHHARACGCQGEPDPVPTSISLWPEGQWVRGRAQWYTYTLWVSSWVRRLDCCGQLAEGAVYLRFNPHSPGWAVDSHVAGPPPCPSARTVHSLPARPTGHLQFQGRQELWEALLFFSELGESSSPHSALHPGGGEEQWRLHSANEAGGWEWGTGAVFHGWLYWPHGAQCGDNKNFLLCSSLFVISKRSRSSAGVTLSGTRCALTRCLNIYFSELWWIFFFNRVSILTSVPRWHFYYL